MICWEFQDYSQYRKYVLKILELISGLRWILDENQYREQNQHYIVYKLIIN